MGRHLILRGVDRRLMGRIREHAAPMEIGAGEWVRSLLIEQLGKRPARIGALQRREPRPTPVSAG